jgi:hypothetical protein
MRAAGAIRHPLRTMLTGAVRPTRSSCHRDLKPVRGPAQAPDLGKETLREL